LLYVPKNSLHCFRLVFDFSNFFWTLSCWVAKPFLDAFAPADASRSSSFRPVNLTFLFLQILGKLQEKGVSESDPQYASVLKLLRVAYSRFANLTQQQQLLVPHKDVSHGIAAPPPPGTEGQENPIAGVQTVQNQPVHQQQQSRGVGKTMSYQWLVSQRDASLKVRFESRIAELTEKLEQMNQAAAAGNPVDESLKRKLLIELKSLQLSGLQSTLRANIAADMHRMASANAATRYGTGSSGAFRRIRKYSVVPDLIPMPERSDRQRQLDLTSGRKKRHRDFIMSVLSHAHKFKEHYVNMSALRTKLNKGLIKWHLNKEKREMAMRERAEKDRIHALKRDNEEEYIKMLQETKNERLLALLAQTDDYLRQIAELVDQEQEAQEEKALEEQIKGSGFDNARIEALQQALNQRREAAAKAAERRMEISSVDATTQANREMRATYYQKIHRVSEDIKIQPSILVGGKLKEYQIDGLQWLISLFNNKLNGILADEMGLGKTIQTIALLAYLKEVKKVEGPFLVVAPLSTISNWANEFSKWCPALKTVIYKGSPVARKAIHSKMTSSGFNACLTTFDFILKDKAQLSRFKWRYIIVDEGHRMKNHNSKLTQALQKHYQSTHRLVLTGTPLQNSLPELWSLLNFLLPNIFNSSDSFETWFNQPFAQTGEKVEMNEEESLLVIKRLHKVLRPFLLRRLKTQVEAQLPDKTEKVLKCDMSAMQKAMYKSLSETGSLQVVSNSGDGKVSSKSMMNIMVQLRKICNHPYLFNQTIDYELDDNIWRAAGKFELLERILPKLKASGHRVLMFSQMTATMNLMEEYFKMRDYTYMRLDGGVKSDDRGQLLADFNAPNSPYFIFILSTRAGGLGLNLQTADTVILFDSDWNPQADLQAQDRAHRIGQKNAVLVLRLCTMNSIEERVLERANYKLDMDQKIIEAGMFHKNASAEDRRTFLLSLLKQTAEEDGQEEVPGDKEINDMIARSPEEYKLFQQMDKHREQLEKQQAERAGLVDPRPRLMTIDELPAWLLIDINKERKEKQEKAAEDYGRGRRVRQVQTYADVDDDLFEQMLIENDQAESAAADLKKNAKAARRAARLAAGGASDSMDDDDDDEDDDVGPGGLKRKRNEDTRARDTAALIAPIFQRISSAVDPSDPSRRLCDLFTDASLEATGDYYSVVGEAISFNEIEAKFSNSEYKSPNQLYDDLKRLCTDAKNYSDSAESKWSRGADALEKLVDSEFQIYGIEVNKPVKKRRVASSNDEMVQKPVAAAAFGDEPSPFPSGPAAPSSSSSMYVAPGVPRVSASAFSQMDDNPFPSEPSPFPSASASSSYGQQSVNPAAAVHQQQQPQQQQQPSVAPIKISLALPKK
jgi:SWI/SNF-related matrix-associated actin-dependent regulator of chromatin subfamily A member 2/4